jgi:hypothetical protein
MNISTSSHYQTKLNQIKADIITPPNSSHLEAESFRTAVFDAALNINKGNELLNYKDIRPSHWAKILRDAENAENGLGIIYDEHHRAECDLRGLKEKLDLSQRKYDRAYSKIRSNRNKKIGIFLLEGILLTFTMWGIFGLSNYPSPMLAPAEDWAMFSAGTLTVLGVLFFGVGPVHITGFIRFAVASLFFLLRSYIVVSSGEAASSYGMLAVILAGLVPVLTYYAYVIDRENSEITSNISEMEDSGETPEYWKDMIGNQNEAVSQLKNQYDDMRNAIELPEKIDNAWESQVTIAADRIARAEEETSRQVARVNTYANKIGRTTFSVIGRA